MGFYKIPTAFILARDAQIAFYSVQRPFRNSELLRSAVKLKPTLHEIDRYPIGSEVSVYGWVRSIRRHKNVSFLALYDGIASQDVQLVLSPSQSDQ
jgi:hypothetical protein